MNRKNVNRCNHMWHHSIVSHPSFILTASSHHQPFRYPRENRGTVRSSAGHFLSLSLPMKGEPRRSSELVESVRTYHRRGSPLEQPHPTWRLRRDWSIDSILFRWRNLGVIFGHVKFVWNHRPARSHGYFPCPPSPLEALSPPVPKSTERDHCIILRNEDT